MGRGDLSSILVWTIDFSVLPEFLDMKQCDLNVLCDSCRHLNKGPAVKGKQMIQEAGIIKSKTVEGWVVSSIEKPIFKTGKYKGESPHVIFSLL